MQCIWKKIEYLDLELALSPEVIHTKPKANINGYWIRLAEASSSVQDQIQYNSTHVLSICRVPDPLLNR